MHDSALAALVYKAYNYQKSWSTTAVADIPTINSHRFYRERNHKQQQPIHLVNFTFLLKKPFLAGTYFPFYVCDAPNMKITILPTVTLVRRPYSEFVP